MAKIELAGCIIMNDNAEILLLHRNTPTLVQRETPGGKIEKGETPEDAAIRELKEELNVDVIITRLIGKKEFTENEYIMNYFRFLAKISSGKLALNEPEMYDAFNFFSIEQLHSMDYLSPNTINLLHAYANNEIYF